MTLTVQYIRRHAGRVDCGGSCPGSMRQQALERRFRRSMGCTPFEEIRRVRLEHVKRLLSEADWDLRRIAHASAFRDARSLGETFRKETGPTPAKYRMRHNRP